MAKQCNISNLSVLAYANKFTLWHYKTSDEQENIYDDNFFDKVADMMNTDDTIMVTTPLFVGQVSVELVDGEVILHELCRSR